MVWPSFVSMTPTPIEMSDSLKDSIESIISTVVGVFEAQLEGLTTNVLALQAECTQEINLRRQETEKLAGLARVPRTSASASASRS